MKDTNELKKMICREYGISLDEFDSQFKYGNIPTGTAVVLSCS